jgi:hypothetical protein
MVTKKRVPRLRLASSARMKSQLRCRSYGAGRDFVTAIAIKIALLRSWKARAVNREQ